MSRCRVVPHVVAIVTDSLSPLALKSFRIDGSGAACGTYMCDGRRTLFLVPRLSLRDGDEDERSGVGVGTNV